MVGSGWLPLVAILGKYKLLVEHSASTQPDADEFCQS